MYRAPSTSQEVTVCYILCFFKLCVILPFTLSEPDIDIISGDTLFVLNSTSSRYCVYISLVSDGDIEGNENLLLSLEEIVTLDSFGVRLLHPNTTNITIIDRDCKCINRVLYF